MNGELARCPCCGEELIVLEDGGVTTPAIAYAIVTRYEEARSWQEAIADDEQRAALADSLPVEDLGGAFELLDGLDDSSD